jgi:hypothetical protein
MLERNVPMVGLVEKKFGWKRVRSEGKEGVEVRYEISLEEWEEWKKDERSRTVDNHLSDVV